MKTLSGLPKKEMPKEVKHKYDFLMGAMEDKFKGMFNDQKKKIEFEAKKSQLINLT